MKPLGMLVRVPSEALSIGRFDALALGLALGVLLQTHPAATQSLPYENLKPGIDAVDQPSSGHCRGRMDALDCGKPMGSDIGIVNVSDYVQPDDVDATLGLKKAVDAANAITRARPSGGIPGKACIYFPPGNYTISAPAPLIAGAGCVRGLGSGSTVISLSASFRGDLFSFSEAWIVYGTSGVQVEGLTIKGACPVKNRAFGVERLCPTSLWPQNALMFYDRNDNVSLRDLYIQDLPGTAIGTGIVKQTKSPPQAYLRESHWSDIHIFSCGTSDSPAVDFETQGEGDEDGTNEVSISDLDIYGSFGTSLAIRNSSEKGVLRGLKFLSLRIEGSENGSRDSLPPQSAPLLAIGDAASEFKGRIGLLQFIGLELIDPYPSSSAILLNAPAQIGYGPSRILLQGLITGGERSGRGLDVEAGDHVFGTFLQMKTGRSNIYLGSRAKSVFLYGYGDEGSWSFAGPGVATGMAHANGSAKSP